ncbi:MAG: sulfatase [Planctomycetes bacterium]|nr:sulfatase [Planctomycetota bacterium]
MSKPPNILLITVHDLGARLGCYGERSVPSPNLDAFAAEGVRFENHFATACYCSPSRGAIITGKPPHVNGLMGLVNLDWDLPASNRNLAKVLGDAGYETYLFGHQHEVKQVEQLGFKHLPDRSVGLSCEKVAPQVAEFLKGWNGEQPFYARVGFVEVHRKYDKYEPDDPASVNVPPYMKDTPGAREDLAMFHGAIRTMDEAVGIILRALDESGRKENTIAVFTTDHGPAFPRAKATLYDPGIHTALLMRWPAGVEGSKVYSELLSNIDLMPTLLDAAGAPAPEDVQGRSFLPLLTGGDYAPNELIFAEKNTHPDDIKRGIRTVRTKYIRNYHEGPMLKLPSDIEASLTRRDMGDDHLRPRPPAELYDLEADPNETDNLAGRPEAAEIEKEMAARLQALLEETNDPVLHPPIPRPPGEEALLQKLRERIERERL